MTTEQQIRQVKTFLDNDPGATDEVVMAFLDQAEELCLNQRYPFNRPEGAVLEDRFHMDKCELAARRFVRTGGLGEMIHIENGVHRDWYSSDDREVLARITPLASVR